MMMGTVAFATAPDTKPEAALSVAPATKSEAPVSSLKTYQDDKNLFRLQYPAKWKIQTPDPKAKNPSPVLVSFAKSDDTAVVSILKAKTDSATSAADFLNQMDQSRKATNQIPEKMRTLKKEIAAKSKVDDAAVGYYEIAGKNPVLQRVLSLKKKNEFFVLTGTFQKANELDEDPLIESILTSFEIIEKK